MLNNGLQWLQFVNSLYTTKDSSLTYTSMMTTTSVKNHNHSNYYFFSLTDLFFQRLLPITLLTSPKEESLGLMVQPHAGSGVVRIDPLRFLGRCCKATKPSSVCLSYLSVLHYCIVLYCGLLGVTFYVLLAFVAVFRHLVVLAKLSLLAT